MRPASSEDSVVPTATDPATRVDAESEADPRRVGFPLLVAGLVTVVLGLLAFLWAQSAPGMAKYAWREVAGVTVGLALPLFLVGVQVLFPTRRGARYATALGLASALAGVAVFAWLYPYNWNVHGRDGSPFGLVPYAAGILLMGGAAFLSLLDAYLDVRMGNPIGTRARAAEREVTQEEITRDLERAGRSRLTWGGVQDFAGPQLRMSAVGVGAQVLHGLVARPVVLDEPLDTGPEVARLNAFRGGSGRATEDADGEAEAAHALLALKEAREAEAEAEAARTMLDRVMTRMRTFFSPWDAATGAPRPPGATAADGEEPVQFIVLDAEDSDADPSASAIPLLNALDALAGAAPPDSGGDSPPRPPNG